MVAIFALVPACDSDSRAKGSGADPQASAGPGVEIVPVAPGTRDGPALIRHELDRAAKDGRKLVVYVGASWCEPCRRFHKAAASGQLDATFPGLRLLEFDSDRDGELLQQTGCTSQMIPLFSRPAPDGQCTPDRLEGAIKGDGAVAWITPRLQSLLEGR